MPRLRRSDPGGTGWTRVRRGRGFGYRDADGANLAGAEAQRCKDLVIPPAWQDVWICPYPNGHIQATGFDDAGRRQYLYHPRWREKQDEAKFERVVELATHLPLARRRTNRDLKGDGLTRDRVCALAFRLLDRGLFRVGSDQYAKDNGSVGLATVLAEHVRVTGDTLLFEFPAKSHQEASIELTDPLAAPIVRELRRRRGGPPGLLAYRIGRTWHDVSSDDVNSYLTEVVAPDFTAKDFRTWHATVLAAVLLARAEPATSPTARKRVVTATMREVSDSLGNTPTMARSAYVDPRLVDGYHAGHTIDPGLAQRQRITTSPFPQTVETAVRDYLS